MNVWRLQTKANICDYCLKNNIAAVGWSLLNITETERKNIKTFEDFEKYAKNTYEKYYSVKRLCNDIQIGDLIWMRDGGKYYLGRVGKNSKYKFDSSKESTELDSCNQRNSIEWCNKSFDESSVPVFDESSVPGAVTTSFIKGSTLQRIHHSGIVEYSALLFDKVCSTKHYSSLKLPLTEDNFYSLLSTADCEDLLCFWLYYKFGYISVPSSNKISTPKYECVLINPKNGNHIYIQVKKSKDGIDIDANDYADLNGEDLNGEDFNGEVWFLTTRGEVKNISVHSNMHEAKPTELFEFAISKEAKNIMSESIKNWVMLLSEYDEKA